VLPFAADFRWLILTFHKSIAAQPADFDSKNLSQGIFPLTGARENNSEPGRVKQGQGTIQGHQAWNLISVRTPSHLSELGRHGCTCAVPGGTKLFAFFQATWHKGREQSDWCNRR
jgi:hypothetical protein